MTEGGDRPSCPGCLHEVWIERPCDSARCGSRPRRQHFSEPLFEFSFWCCHFTYLPSNKIGRLLTAAAVHPWAPPAMPLPEPS